MLLLISTFSAARKSQQAQTLRLKQEKFRQLAVKAKQQGISIYFFDINIRSLIDISIGDNDTAKKFLIAYKGLDQMISAAESGLPVDMSQV